MNAVRLFVPKIKLRERERVNVGIYMNAMIIYMNVMHVFASSPCSCVPCMQSAYKLILYVLYGRALRIYQGTSSSIFWWMQRKQKTKGAKKLFHSERIEGRLGTYRA